MAPEISARLRNITANIEEVVVTNLPKATTTSKQSFTQSLVDATKSNWASPRTQSNSPVNIEVVVHRTHGADYYF